MLSVIATAAAVAAAPALASTPLSLRGPTLLHDGLSLHDFQGILQTGLDEELNLIAAGQDRRGALPQPPQHQPPARRGNIRRRDAPRQPAAGSPHAQQEVVWSHLLHHAWNAAESISRGGGGALSLSGDAEDSASRQALQCPFLLCSTGGESASSLLERFDGSLPWTPSGQGERCVVFGATADRAREAMASNRDLVAQPLVDIMKIHPGTMDSVTSQGWRVPFRDGDQDERSRNTTEISVQHWERTLTVGLAPGSDLKEESSLVELVETIMRDLHSMSEVGWLARQAGDAAQESRYLEGHHLAGVPSLSDMLSVTSAKYQADYGSEMAENGRIAFWDGALSDGLESSHACESMFNAIFVDPRPEDGSFVIVLNPNDGPPPRDRESSASNANCVISLIAGLSVHPAVATVEANVPLYYGWTAAALDES